MSKLVPVILCGGSGTRLWPLSRAGFPKQFLCLTGNNSLFQQAALRLNALSVPGVKTLPSLVVCNEDHRFLAQEQLREIRLSDAGFLLEPTGRNTAPALTLAALAAQQNGEDPVLVVTPADQTIADEAAFQNALQTAVVQAQAGQIAILGVTPDRPETGYGYIRTGTGSEANSALPVLQFVEKPNLATAQGYLAQGGYFWNAGMFVLKASVWLQALAHFRPDIANATQAAWAAQTTDGPFVRPNKALFGAVPSESVDYAVMERCPAESQFPICMVPLNAGWNDLGAWDAVWNALPKNAEGNAFVGDVISANSHHNLVNANGKLVALVGVSNLVVVDTPDALLVASQERSQDVKLIVNELTKRQREELNLHRKVHRPWGWYDSIDQGGRFKVKRIMVKPKASLSLQKHHHRAEHWIVVSGTAEITNGDQVLLLTENQSTYIPLGAVHRLVNPGTIPLEIVEVQSGSYLGEDDIVRLEDTYGRAPAAK